MHAMNNISFNQKNFKQFAHKNAMKDMDTVRSLVNADARLGTWGKIATNVIHTQAVRMEIADDHGNVIASE